jgi:hypothetical protein
LDIYAYSLFDPNKAWYNQIMLSTHAKPKGNEILQKPSHLKHNVSLNTTRFGEKPTWYFFSIIFGYSCGIFAEKSTAKT